MKYLGIDVMKNVQDLDIEKLQDYERSLQN